MNSRKEFANLKKRFLQLLIFLLPTQLGYHFWPSWAYVFGIRADYLAPTVYLTDVLLVSIVGIWFLERKAEKPAKEAVFIAVALSLLAIINIGLAKVPPIALFKWAKFFEVVLLAYLIKTDKKLDLYRVVLAPLALSAALLLTIALGQFFLQHSLGGPFYYVGERAFNSGTPGISLYSILGHLRLRPYATFSHPNSMAGFFGVAALLLLASFPGIKKGKGKGVLYLGAVSSLATLALAGSGAAYVAILVAGAAQYLIAKMRFSAVRTLTGVFWGTIFFALLLPFANTFLADSGVSFSESLSQRLFLAEGAGRLFSKMPWLGYGANNFIVALSSQKETLSSSWILQPVHNVALLVLVEMGIVLFIIFTLYANKVLNWLGRNSPAAAPAIIFILLTGSFDHYWITLQQNLLLLGVAFGVFLRPNTRKFLLN